MHVYTPDTRAAYAARELAIVLRSINFDLWALRTWIGGQYTMGAWEMADGVSSTIIDSDLLCSGETAQDTHALNVRAQSYNNRCLYVDDSTLTRKTLCESPIFPA